LWLLKKLAKVLASSLAHQSVFSPSVDEDMQNHPQVLSCCHWFRKLSCCHSSVEVPADSGNLPDDTAVLWDSYSKSIVNFLTQQSFAFVGVYSQD